MGAAISSGTDRVSDLVLPAPGEWLQALQQSRQKLDRVRSVTLSKILEQLRGPLKNVAAVNAEASGAA
ncbi:hypothetical protein [Thermogemmatispora sp.]|uniref:hypothetical protein n=1 Tax=Thermogemmatispora sp. TaxID=1968838 RepID=UPI0035E43236